MFQTGQVSTIPAAIAAGRHYAENFGAAAIFVADAALPGAPVVFVNERFTRATGLLHDSVIGRGWGLLGIDAPSPRAHTAAGAEADPLAVNLPNFGGDAHTATRFLVHAIRNGGGAITAYVGISPVSAWLDI